MSSIIKYWLPPPALLARYNVDHYLVFQVTSYNIAMHIRVDQCTMHTSNIYTKQLNCIMLVEFLETKQATSGRTSYMYRQKCIYWRIHPRDDSTRMAANIPSTTGSSGRVERTCRLIQAYRALAAGESFARVLLCALLLQYPNKIRVYEMLCIIMVISCTGPKLI